jgi:uncharacterized protein
MIHPFTEIRFISPEKGYGVVAKQFIPKGTITWVQDKLDMVFDREKIEELGDSYAGIIDTYCFRDNQGNHILCWDNARFVNHSFNSNCLTTPYNFEIAIRDIQIGEELTDDYGYLNITEPFEGIPEDGFRHVVYPDDLTRYHKIWDEKIADAMQYIQDVQQPLLNFLNDTTQSKIKAILKGEIEMESILTCYYDQNKTAQ